MMQASKRGRHPTMIYINQVRSRVGVVYGNPEIMPGGNAPRFQANIVLRVYGKNLIDANDQYGDACHQGHEVRARQVEVP